MRSDPIFLIFRISRPHISLSVSVRWQCGHSKSDVCVALHLKVNDARIGVSDIALKVLAFRYLGCQDLVLFLLRLQGPRISCENRQGLLLLVLLDREVHCVRLWSHG